MTTGTSSRAAHREAAIAEVQRLLALLQAEPGLGEVAEIIDLAEHLERAVRAFHMEAIRFRMFSLDRALKSATVSPATVEVFGQVRRELEAAGFATRSHA